MHAIHTYTAPQQSASVPFRMDVGDATEVVRALAVQKPGFLDFLRQADWRIIRRRWRKNQERDGQSLRLAIGNAKEIHFIPVPTTISAAPKDRRPLKDCRRAEVMSITSQNALWRKACFQRDANQ
jgi:predicted phage tail protein